MSSRGARSRAATALDCIGCLTKQPPYWVGAAALLASRGGDRGRRAALRGIACYAAAAVAANLVLKPLVHRRRPPQSQRQRIAPLTSSFPSGHAASDLAFAFGVAHELPALFPVFALSTSAAHWSLVRTHSHYLSDVLVGGALGIASAAAVKRIWPPRPRHAR